MGGTKCFLDTHVPDLVVFLKSLKPRHLLFQDYDPFHISQWHEVPRTESLPPSPARLSLPYQQSYFRASARVAPV